jgi:hypothetical protein
MTFWLKIQIISSSSKLRLCLELLSHTQQAQAYLIENYQLQNKQQEEFRLLQQNHEQQGTF